MRPHRWVKNILAFGAIPIAPIAHALFGDRLGALRIGGIALVMASIHPVARGYSQPAATKDTHRRAVRETTRETLPDASPSRRVVRLGATVSNPCEYLEFHTDVPPN